MEAAGEPATWHHRLLTAYQEPHRHYHNLRHLDECLRELDAARALALQPTAVEAALWFHDAVYDPQSGTNEEDSAALASTCFYAAGLPASCVDTIQNLILCTKTHQPGNDGDSRLLTDIDLAILGQPASRFLEYERDIKAEYTWVPAAIYSRKRSEILAGFLQRPVIYHTAFFRERYESAARTNLGQAIRSLTEITP